MVILRLVWMYIIVTIHIVQSELFLSNTSIILPKDNHTCPRNVSWIEMNSSGLHSCCIFHVNVDSFGWISTPQSSVNYLGYEPGITCEWLLQCSSTKPIQLIGRFMRLMEDDKLVIYDANGELVTYDGHRGGSWTVMANSGEVRIRLISYPIPPNLSVQSMREELYGFNITYQLAGVCIPGIQQSCTTNVSHCYAIETEACDGIWDCVEDGSDEWNCSNSCVGTDKYYCPPLREEDAIQHFTVKRMGDAECYNRTERCDGYTNCPGLQDEKLCSDEECDIQNGTWKCPTSGECIYIRYRCDGEYGDCIDNRDEENCDLAAVDDSHGTNGDPFYQWRKLPSPLNVIVIVCTTLALGLILLISLHYFAHHYAERLVAQNPELFQRRHTPLQVINGSFQRRCPPSAYEIYPVTVINSTINLLPRDEDEPHSRIPSVTATLAVPISVPSINPAEVVIGQGLRSSSSSLPSSSQTDIFCLDVTRVSGARG